MIYKIYIEQNLADTSRDPSNIVTTELGYKLNLQDAIDIAETYIKNNFNNDVILSKRNNGEYVAFNSCSYGKSIHVVPIKAD